MAKQKKIKKPETCRGRRYDRSQYKYVYCYQPSTTTRSEMRPVGGYGKVEVPYCAECAAAYDEALRENALEAMYS